MDTSHYYITCKGKEQGPYRFYQLQQLRTNDELVESQFEPDEWYQLVGFIDSGQMPKRSGGKIYIREEDIHKRRRYPLLVFLTYLGRLLGLGFFVGGLLQGEEDYILRSEPMFYLGLISCIGLCFTIVNAAVHALYYRQDHPAAARVFLVYFGGLVPAMTVVAITTAVAQLVLPDSNITAGQVMEIGWKYLGIAAVVALYVPFHYRAIHDKPAPRKTHSVMWMFMPLFVSALALLYFLPETIGEGSRIAEARQIFFVESGAMANSRFDWQYPVKLGDRPKTVQRRLGKPDEIVDEDYVYGFGVRVAFDGRERVAKLRFDAEFEGASELKHKPIISGVTTRMNKKQFETLFQMESTALFSDAKIETAVWGDEYYRITACFAKAPEEEAAAGQSGALKWMEITRTEQ